MTRVICAMQANETRDHDAMVEVRNRAADLCCEDCHFVIAPLHDSPRG